MLVPWLPASRTMRSKFQSIDFLELHHPGAFLSLSYNSLRLPASQCTFLQEEYDCLSPTPSSWSLEQSSWLGESHLISMATCGFHQVLWLGITPREGALVTQDTSGPLIHMSHSHSSSSYLVLQSSFLPINRYIIFLLCYLALIFITFFRIQVQVFSSGICYHN